MTRSIFNPLRSFAAIVFMGFLCDVVRADNVPIDTNALATLAVQDHGRKKPFTTFAQAATNPARASAKALNSTTEGNVCVVPKMSGQTTVVPPSANVLFTRIASISAWMSDCVSGPQS